jgi:uncharacterized repeat protein (TIGR03803 family)
VKKQSLGMLVLFIFTCTFSLHAQTFTSLFSFDQTDGDNPHSNLVQGANGNLYGTTSSDSGSGYGTVFEITPGGVLTTLYSFCSLPNCADGSNPVTGLTKGSNGNFYGVAGNGGAYNAGTVFEITPSGTLTTLYSFCSQANCVDGSGPVAALLQASDGNLYGSTYKGGTTGYGTLFKITPTGTLTTLHSFCLKTNCADGSSPYGTLLQTKSGNFFGTTYTGGANESSGTIFKLTPAGKLFTLYSFCAKASCADGDGPYGGLLLTKNGDLYGTTGYGGYPGSCYGPGCGTIFAFTSSNRLIPIHSFCGVSNCVDGALPMSALIVAANGNLYGTTDYGGSHCLIDDSASGCGTIFEITPTGKFIVLHSFDSTDGANPLSSLMQATDGTLYGSTFSGGPSGWGTIFSYVP